MVVCVVDDLIFSVKISTAARALGTPVFFERDPDNALASVRDRAPSLVIFDLNAARLRPLDIISSMKADPVLQAVRTLGYVSHVDSDVIASARRAGIDEVLARSAFSDRIGDILTGESGSPGLRP